VRERAYDILRRGREVFVALAEELSAAGVHLLDYGQLDDEQRAAATSTSERPSTRC